MKSVYRLLREKNYKAKVPFMTKLASSTEAEEVHFQTCNDSEKEPKIKT
jgi:hypothetical protein